MATALLPCCQPAASEFDFDPLVRCARGEQRDEPRNLQDAAMELIHAGWNLRGCTSRNGGCARSEQARAAWGDGFKKSQGQ